MAEGPNSQRLRLETQSLRMVTMKTLLIVLSLSAMSFAGVARFSAKHVIEPAAKGTATGTVTFAKAGKDGVHFLGKNLIVKPVGKASYPARHPKKAAKVSSKAVASSAKLAKAIVY